ncbi:MAG: hypothetical protein LBU94_01945 [Clostridiales bacterium]|nr:hypothetical protein [Clostridiales bacterium]
MNIYLVCVNKSENNHTVLEIYHSYDIFKPMVNSMNLSVLAVCSGKKYAIDVCMDILLKKYLTDRDFSFSVM